MTSVRTIFYARGAIAVLLAGCVVGIGLAQRELASHRQGAFERIDDDDIVTGSVKQPEPPDTQLAAIPQQPIPSARAGNPLWDIPLGSLSATRERPLFQSSRRPPVITRPSAPAPSAAPRQAPPALVGAIAGDSDGFAILLDPRDTTAVIRLRIGESYSGWTLLSVNGREATIQNDGETTTLMLPGPSAK